MIFSTALGAPWGCILSYDAHAPLDPRIFFCLWICGIWVFVNVLLTFPLRVGVLVVLVVTSKLFSLFAKEIEGISCRSPGCASGTQSTCRKFSHAWWGFPSVRYGITWIAVDRMLTAATPSLRGTRQGHGQLWRSAVTQPPTPQSWTPDRPASWNFKCKRRLIRYISSRDLAGYWLVATRDLATCAWATVNFSSFNAWSPSKSCGVVASNILLRTLDWILSDNFHRPRAFKNTGSRRVPHKKIRSWSLCLSAASLNSV